MNKGTSGNGAYLKVGSLDEIFLKIDAAMDGVLFELT